jgi:hypothetical protein
MSELVKEFINFKQGEIETFVRQDAIVQVDVELKPDEDKGAVVVTVTLTHGGPLTLHGVDAQDFLSAFMGEKKKKKFDVGLG